MRRAIVILPHKGSGVGIFRGALKPTRNDVGDPQSACDVVSAAALALSQSGYKYYATGYGYDNLKKMWNKYAKI